MKQEELDKMSEEEREAYHKKGEKKAKILMAIFFLYVGGGMLTIILLDEFKVVDHHTLRNLSKYMYEFPFIAFMAIILGIWGLGTVIGEGKLLIDIIKSLLKRK